MCNPRPSIREASSALMAHGAHQESGRKFDPFLIVLH